jgi:hypothetical protein
MGAKLSKKPAQMACKRPNFPQLNPKVIFFGPWCVGPKAAMIGTKPA